MPEAKISPAAHRDNIKSRSHPAQEEGWMPLIHRADRCDLSLFQLGLRLLQHFLNLDEDIPVSFYILELETVKSVR